MKASVCIEMIFTEYPFLERIEKAAEIGFEAIEFGSWEDKNLPAIKAKAEQAGLAIASFQSNLGGTLPFSGHRGRFVAGVQRSLKKAQEMSAPSLFLLTDEMDEHYAVRFQFPELSEETKYQSVLDGLKVLAQHAEEAGIALLLEPLNTKDYPGYFLHRSSVGFDLIRAVGSPYIRLLYDIYHMQMMEGDIIHTLTANLDLIGHIHVADVPGRHEPGTGELNYARIFQALREASYGGYVGFEFIPVANSEKAAAEALALLKGRFSVCC